MTIPNIITLIRLAIVPFFFTALVSYQEGQEHYRLVALALFVFASLTDAVDGFLARVLNAHSNLGKILDPLADKSLLISGYLGLLWVQALPIHPPLWVTVVIVFRDMVLLPGILILYSICGYRPLQPNFLGKVTTATQMVTLVLVLLQFQIVVVISYFTAGITILSLLSYVKRGLNILVKEHKIG